MAASYFPDTLPHVGNCAGSEGAAVFGCALLTSYLGLFVNFYFQTYKKPALNGVANGGANGSANGKANGSVYPLCFAAWMCVDWLHL